MNGLKRKEEEIGLIDLDDKDDPVDQQETDAGQGEQQQKAARKKRNQSMALAGILAGSISLLLLGIFLLQVSLVTIGFVIVIEAVVAVSLNNSELWIHVAVMAIQAALGIWTGHTLFLLLAAAYYFVLVIALKLLELDG